jgi:hypothetical protein
MQNRFRIRIHGFDNKNGKTVLLEKILFLPRNWNFYSLRILKGCSSYLQEKPTDLKNDNPALQQDVKFLFFLVSFGLLDPVQIWTRPTKTKPDPKHCRLHNCTQMYRTVCKFYVGMSWKKED